MKMNLQTKPDVGSANLFVNHNFYELKSAMLKQSTKIITNPKKRRVSIMTAKLDQANQPLNMKHKTNNERLEDKLHYFYNNYSSNGYTFEKHMPFVELEEEKESEEGEDEAKISRSKTKENKWWNIANLILRYKGKTFTKALNRINKRYNKSMAERDDIENQNGKMKVQLSPYSRFQLANDRTKNNAI